MATVDHTNKLLQGLKEDGMSLKGISDGYHTFGELYDHRNALFIALCRMLYWFHPDTHFPDGIQVWRSKKHSDGSMFEDMFILGINVRSGEQITYHLPVGMWSLTHFADTRQFAPEWDGHTSHDVIERLYNLLDNTIK